MKYRLAFALVVFLGLTAFAPAPFPKTGKRGQPREMTLDAFQGRWRVTNMQTSRANGQHVPYTWSVTHIGVKNDRWQFLSNNEAGNGAGGMVMTIDPGKRPSHLNFYNGTDKNVYGVGQIRRLGNKVQVIYTWGGEAVRPTFEPPCDRGWIITMERD